jgi:hypothetical protein
MSKITYPIPQKPYLEQHARRPQVYLVEPPQLPSGLGVSAATDVFGKAAVEADDAAADDTTADDALADDTAADEAAAEDALADDTAAAETAVPEQVPNDDWQPVSQNATPAPQ